MDYFKLHFQLNRDAMFVAAVRCVCCAVVCAGISWHSVANAAAVGVPAKVVRYAQWIVLKYDENGNEQLESSEWRWMHGNPKQIDVNSDDVITIEEFTNYIVLYGSRRRMRLDTPPAAPSAGDYESTTPHSSSRPTRTVLPKALPKGPTTANVNGPIKAPKGTRFYVDRSRLPNGLPSTFIQRDKDGDGQLTLFEYSPKVSPTTEKEFNRYDVNRDGVITAREYVGDSGKSEKSRSTSVPSSAGTSLSPNRASTAPSSTRHNTISVPKKSSSTDTALSAKERALKQQQARAAALEARAKKQLSYKLAKEKTARRPTPPVKKEKSKKTLLKQRSKTGKLK